jgi:3-oxoacyl-[acyl-carrier-protein] synthase-3
MTPLPVRIAGAGYYLPERRVDSAELEARMGLPAGWVERLTGVRERRRVSGETSSEMGARAARMALDHAGSGPAPDLIIGGSAAPQQAIPCTAVFVQRALDLAETGCFCFDVNATCLSFFAALDTAARLVAAGAYRRALVYSSEITSWSLNYDEPESAVLFGDAAAAVVLEPTGPDDPARVWGSRFRTDSRGAELTRLVGGGTLHHPNDAGTRPEMNTFAMDGRGVYKMATRLMEPFLDGFLADVGWQREEIAAVVPHQASRRAIELLWKRLGFREEQAVVNLPDRGNCLAASTPLALAEAVHAGRIRRGDRILLAGTGAGVSVAAIALTY